MSWLNLNNSLNTIKGQISNFASNVLADEEGPETVQKDYEELKNICVQQEIEINDLKRINMELREKQVQKHDSSHIPNSGEILEWNLNDSHNQKVNISDLKRRVEELESEKKELITQLEQLDSENQQNLLKIISVKDKLQQENNDLKHKYKELKEQNDVLIKKQKELENEAKEEEERTTSSSHEYSEKYESYLQENQSLKLKFEEADKEICVLKSNNDTLQKILEESKIANQEEMRTATESIKRLESENKIIYLELQKAKDDINRYEKKSSEDAENCQKLAFILESYDKQVSSLKKELEETNEKLQTNGNNDEITKKLKEVESINKNNEKEIQSLVKEVEDLNILNKQLQGNNEQLAKENLKITEQFKTYENNQAKLISSLKEKNNKLQTDKSNNESLATLERKLDNFKDDQRNILLQLHKKYVSIITENIRKIQDCGKPSDFEHCEPKDVDPQIGEFSKHVEDILKILLDFKCKCEALEKKVYDLSEERTNILTEKNHEIEKLMQNSEILSHEVIVKTQIIKDFENECNDLVKNNELLINELETYKNNSCLQPISESNEDNMVLLETQLENANKRIEDLEKIIDDFERQQKKSIESQSENELENSLKQLHLSESEIATKDQNYQELLNSFDQLNIEYDNLKYDLESTKDELKDLNEENMELKSNLEKIKLDYENTEYQLCEIKINSDGLKEDIEGNNYKIDKLIAENNKLKSQNDICKNNMTRNELRALRETLLLEQDNGRKLEFQIRNLTEKLQNAKMTETSLKLQYDTLSKEVIAISEAKNNFEISLEKSNSDLAHLHNRFLEMQDQNEKLYNDYGELQEMYAKREKQIKNFEGLVTELQTKLQKYEELAVDENEELLRQLSINDNMNIVQELKLQLAKYESLAVEENEQLFKNMTIDDNETLFTKMDVDVKENNKEYEGLKRQFEVVLQEKSKLQSELNEVNQTYLRETAEKQDMLQQQLKELTASRNELINIVTTKHNESVAYHNEIQRLSQILTSETDKCKNLEMQFSQLKTSYVSSEEIELKNQELETVLEQNSFLKEKCEIMGKNLLEEQTKLQQLLAEKLIPSEKEISLQKKLERLQTHLIELEEHYTQELLQAEQKNTELQTKLNEIKEREQNSSTMYTSVSIRANQQLESLQNQLQMVILERDGLRKKISDAEDVHSKQAAALANLQFVLEQFQKDKEKDVIKETARIRKQINIEKQVQEDLRKEIMELKSQLEESKQGLQAASRLSDQLELSKKLVGTLKEEVSSLEEQLAKSETKLKNAMSQTDGKVDKSLIKNLVIGFLSSNNNNLNKDQQQILKIIATVLDFNQQEHEKINLNKTQQGSWLSLFLSPLSGNPNMTNESLSQAFIKFLENESKPRVIPSLLNASIPESTVSTNSSTPRQSPIVLNEIVLPTFADFAQTRNCSAILKDVLKDNS